MTQHFRSRGTLLVSAAGLWLGCGGPQMESHAVTKRMFTANQRCSQGPLITHFLATGARWGESIAVTACGVRGLRGRIDVAVDGRWANAGHLLGGDADNAYCLGGDPVLVAHGKAAAAGRAKSSAASPHRGTPLSPPGRTAVQQFRRISADSHDCFAKPTMELVLGPQKKGADIRVRIWSNLPNDFAGAFLRIVHNRLKPNVSDKKWRAHVAAERRKRRARAKRETHKPPAPRPRPVSSPTRPPPPPRVETRPPRPSAMAAWVPGYWTWAMQHKQWAWVSGSWKTAPSPQHRWRRPRWTRRSGVWILVPGAWIRIR